MKFSRHITEATGICDKHTWRYVRYAGIEPQRGENGRLCITDEEFAEFIAALKSGAVEVRQISKKQKPKREPQPDDYMRERVALPPEQPKPVKRPGYLYIPAVGAGRPFDWAQSVGK